MSKLAHGTIFTTPGLNRRRAGPAIVPRRDGLPELRFRVESELHGIRIDSFLAKHFRNHAVWRFQRMVRAGLIWIDDHPASETSRVQRGNEVRIHLAEPPEDFVRSDSGELSVLYDDPWMIVVDKPAGMIAHPVSSYSRDTLLNRVQAWIGRQTSPANLLRAGIVHRLDRMTSGVQVLVKNHLAHTALAKQFATRSVNKSYLAIVSGTPDWSHREVNLPIGVRPGGNTILMTTAANARNAKRAETRLKVRQRFDGYCLIEAIPLTGRLHQIRVHLAELGFPIVGDRLYGSHPEQDHEPDRTTDANSRHLLHAATLTLSHPVTDRRMTFSAPLPDDFSGFKAVPE